MPIRINLLAEQQAAEEARRRDPVKRSAWCGGAAVVLVLLWCVVMQLKVGGARSEYAALDLKWKGMESNLLQSSNALMRLVDVSSRLDSLQSHSTNRFLWANVLNALQHTVDPQVRVVALEGRSLAKLQAGTVVSSNIIGPKPASSWLPWAEQVSTRNIPEEGRAAMGLLTNRADLLPYQSMLSPGMTVTTNLFGMVAAKIEIVKPDTVTERIGVTIRARDYSTPPGSHVDRFFAAVTNAPFFRNLLSETNSSVQPESIQPRVDTTDLIAPTAPYIPLTIDLHLPPRIRANE
ncbi:MAG: hypothetical protein K9N62_02790 [Verrucomicrobia bacterium]|jgi:hypothetical protein|nr:hypothetical protein [Verrucomicrobiota bacterium]